MKVVGNIWYAAMADLVNTCGVNYRTIEKGYTSGSPIWQSIKDPDDNRRRLIRYDTLKSTYKALARTVLCEGLEPDQWYKKQLGKNVASNTYTLVERLEVVLRQGYRKYEGLYVPQGDSRVVRKTAMCLARAAGVVELLVDWSRSRSDLDPRSYAPYDEVIDWFNQEGNYDYYFPKGCQYLPMNRVILKEKVLERTIGRKENKRPRENNPLPITEVIFQPRKGNRNRDEFASDAELNAWLVMARMHGRNDTNAYVIRKIQNVCQIVGREVPSASWFSQVLASAKMKQLTAPTRHGGDSAHTLRYTHSITMARAMYAGDCWMMDATRINMIEHATKDGEKRFLVAIAVRDAYSGEIVGIHFDTKEDRWGYTNALKMAVKATGYLPHTLVHDRFPGHLTDEMNQVLGAIERKGVELVCTHKATGKALLERWWDTLQTVFLAQSKYYYGQGIKSTRVYAHRSPEYLTKIRQEAGRDGWDFDQAWQEAWQRIEEYRQTPLSHYSRVHKSLDLTPMQLHQQSEKPNVITVDIWEQASLFWMTKVLKIERNAIKHEVHGKTFEYPIYDTELLYRYQRVAIKYEAADPSSIMLFAVDAQDVVSDFFICELNAATPVPMYGPDADPAKLAKRQAMGKRVTDQRKADLEEIVQGAHQDPEYLLNMGRSTPKDVFESVESQVLYQHMSGVVSTPASVVRAAKDGPPKPTKKAPPPPAQVIDINAFVNY